MERILNLLSFIGPISIMICLVILALLSQRLGAVTRRAPIYRWLFLSSSLIGVSVFVRAISPDQIMNETTALLYDLPMAVGLILAVVIAWQYWGWLLGERGNGA